MSNTAVALNREKRDCRHPQLHAPITSERRHDHCAGGHDHHHHHHHHSHADSHRPQQQRALWLCLLLTLVMMIIEFAAGWVSGSLMLASDAVHMLSHVAALGISLIAIKLANKQCGDHLPYGLYRLEVLAALLNGLGLAGFSMWIVYEGIDRLLHPVAISGHELLVVAVLGLAVNVITAVILFRAGLEDLNTKGAWLHMLADGVSSIVIVLGAIVIVFTGWRTIDPTLSILVALVVGKWAWGLLRDAVMILLEHKPDQISLQDVEAHLLREFPEIRDVHDLHVWEITSHYFCCSAHVVLDDLRLSETQRLRAAVADDLRRHFGIGHAVIQFEC
ncbi:MAG: cation diffusion facilitator family transporter [Blastocatellia bacterium]|nr:cation diffusion facilitator family transporter [Blastocatellia bacterium]